MTASEILCTGRTNPLHLSALNIECWEVLVLDLLFVSKDIMANICDEKDGNISVQEKD